MPANISKYKVICQNDESLKNNEIPLNKLMMPSNNLINGLSPCHV